MTKTNIILASTILTATLLFSSCSSSRKCNGGKKVQTPMGYMEKPVGK